MTNPRLTNFRHWRTMEGRASCEQWMPAWLLDGKEVCASTAPVLTGTATAVNSRFKNENSTVHDAACRESRQHQ